MVIVITKNLELYKTNGHGYRLLSMVESSDDIILVPINKLRELSIGKFDKVVVDIPGVKFIQLLKISKFIKIDAVFLQDSICSFFYNKLKFLIKIDVIEY